MPPNLKQEVKRYDERAVSLKGPRAPEPKIVSRSMRPLGLPHLGQAGTMAIFQTEKGGEETVILLPPPPPRARVMARIKELDALFFL